MLIKSIKFNKFMRLSGGFSDGRRWAQRPQPEKESLGSVRISSRSRCVFRGKYTHQSKCQDAPGAWQGVSICAVTEPALLYLAPFKKI